MDFESLIHLPPCKNPHEHPSVDVHVTLYQDTIDGLAVLIAWLDGFSVAQGKGWEVPGLSELKFHYRGLAAAVSAVAYPVDEAPEDDMPSEAEVREVFEREGVTCNVTIDMGTSMAAAAEEKAAPEAEVRPDLPWERS